MSSKFQLYMRLILLIVFLTSCSSILTSPSPTSISPPPTNAEVTTPRNESSLFKAGVRYSDAAGDMEVSFLDVTGFQASVHEESETLEVVLHMRDVPPTATLGQVKNLVEYLWMIFVYLDPSQSTPASIAGDYYFGLNTNVDEPYADVDRPIPGTPVVVPIDQLFEIKDIYNSSGMSVSIPEVIANPDLDTLTVIGHIPGITSNAGFRFSMNYYDGTKDISDSEAPPTSVILSTPLANITGQPSTGEEGLHLEKAGTVRAFPGPEHYAGDILTFAIQATGDFDESVMVSVAIDDQKPREAPGTFYWFDEVIVPSALDTRNLAGHHTLKFTTSNGDLNQTYSFAVLPADQRPTNETRAAWMVKETDCCIFHYLSETAGARDIDFISEHFKQGADEFETLMKAEIRSKMDIYIIDRILGNGGFGGNGQLVISYTDRYYGPTMGGEGLETLARHEFSHAAGIGFENAGDGVDFNYEGLAVYVAGGHYKPEPLAQRGAALFDLGHSVPVDEFIPQHELSYLHAAVILTYIVETYGEEKLGKFLSADDDTPDEQLISMEDAIRLTFGISLEEFDHGFQAWLEKNDPGEQLDDLRLTVELQDVRREYQDLYSPGPLFLISEIDLSAVTRREYLPVVMREARTSPNIAIELMIANAQRAINSGAYSEAEQLIRSIKEVVSTSDFEDPLAKEHLEIVLAAAKGGYEVVSLNLQNGYATAQVTKEPPVTTVLELKKVDGIWQIEP